MNLKDFKGRKIYIAGPMRGILNYNFDAFDQAAVYLATEGLVPVNPAELDRQDGSYESWELFRGDTEYNWDKFPGDDEDFKVCVARDISHLLKCDAIYLLKGWEKSYGAKAELAAAEWLGLTVFYQEPESVTKEVSQEEDILETALRITKGDRNDQYGPPDQDFQRTAQMWSALKGVEFKAKEVAMFMICLKLSRETHQGKTDNWVDMAGYSRCGNLCSD